MPKILFSSLKKPAYPYEDFQDKEDFETSSKSISFYFFPGTNWKNSSLRGFRSD